MTSSKWGNDIIPADNPVVERIMRERGVGRKRAYVIAKQESAASVDVSTITRSQKEAVLAALIAHPEARRGEEVLAILHADGVKTDMHDVVKMLWACQKSGWVSFREKGGHKGLYAIKVTDAGRHADNLRTVARAIETSATREDEQHTNGTAVEEPPVQVGIVVGGRSREWDGPVLGHYPLIDELIRRADKADRLEQAAEILEQAGEDDLATQVITKINFTQLDKEVIRLARAVFPGQEET